MMHLPPDLLSLTTMTLATTGPDGEPHAAAVYFAADENLRFYFFSDVESQHSRDIQDNPRAAVAHWNCWQTFRKMFLVTPEPLALSG